MTSTAAANFWLYNEAAGQRSRFTVLPGDTHGQRFVVEYINQPYRGETAVPAHIHTTFTEVFEILRGRAKYRLAGETRTAMAGDRILMPPRIPHVHPWSDSDEELHVRQTATSNPPDLAGMIASIQGALTIQGLAQAGLVNDKGIPGLLQTAVIIEAAMPATFIAGPPIWLQRAVFGLLSRIGRRRGLQTAYAQYGRITPEGLQLPG